MGIIRASLGMDVTWKEILHYIQLSYKQKMESVVKRKDKMLKTATAVSISRDKQGPHCTCRRLQMGVPH